MTWKQSPLQALKTQLVEEIERMEAKFIDDGYRPDDIAVLCSSDDVEEFQMLLDDLYPKSKYRAVAVNDAQRTQ